MRQIPAIIIGCLCLSQVAWAEPVAENPTTISATSVSPTSHPADPSDEQTVDDEPAQDIEESPVYTLVNEQLLLLATILGAVAALPALIEFMVERRKRKERISLSLDDLDVATLKPRLAGFDELLTSIEDLIDRACNPDAYQSIEVGNELLILGASLGGKKTLAQELAKRARLERLIIVYNLRNADALAKVKSLVRSYGKTKLMLLLPRVDQIFEKEDDDLSSELEALIETMSERSNVLVVGTAQRLRADSALDNLFGIKLVLPGTPVEEAIERESNPAARQLLTKVARFYLDQILSADCRMEGLTPEQFVDRLLMVVNNPAEIQDIAVLCQTTALHRQRKNKLPHRLITPDILELSIGRVIVSPLAEGTSRAKPD